MDEDIRALERELQRAGKRVIVVDTDDFKQFFWGHTFLPDLQFMSLEDSDPLLPRVNVLYKVLGDPTVRQVPGLTPDQGQQLINKWKAAKMASIRGLSRE